MNRKIDFLGRITIPAEMRKKLKINKDDELNIIESDNKIIITKNVIETREIKTVDEIKEQLHNLNELVKCGLDDEKLMGTIDGLKWVLDTTENPNSYLNDYDDIKEEVGEAE